MRSPAYSAGPRSDPEPGISLSYSAGDPTKRVPRDTFAVEGYAEEGTVVKLLIQDMPERAPMDPDEDAESQETLQELLKRQKRENQQRVLDLNGPGRKPDVIKNERTR